MNILMEFKDYFTNLMWIYYSKLSWLSRNCLRLKKKPKTDESEYESSYIISSNCYKLFKNYIWRYASKLDVLLLSEKLNIKTDFSNDGKRSHFTKVFEKQNITLDSCVI